MLESKLSDWLKRIYKGDKKLRLFILLGAVGMILILLSEMLPSAKTSPKKTDDMYQQYIASLEKETAELIASIDGAGRCRVMITLKDGNESVYARNTQENNSDSSISRSDEYIFCDGESGDEPVLIKQYFPRIQGIAVVCDGAEDTFVRESILQSLSSLYNVPVSKISVSKLKG